MYTIPLPLQVLELYDKGCQADLGGTMADAGGAEQGSDAVCDGTQSQTASISTSLLKKTPEKRRNHLR